MSPCRDEEAFLHVPPLEKQFLISPPCSPPVGWEQPREDKPVVDYDLLAAMAQLSPGKITYKPFFNFSVVKRMYTNLQTMMNSCINSLCNIKLFYNSKLSNIFC